MVSDISGDDPQNAVIAELAARCIVNMDIRGLSLANKALPGGLEAYIDVPTVGLSLCSALIKSVDSASDNTSGRVRNIEDSCIFFSESCHAGINFRRQDGDGTTVIHHMFKGLVKDALMEQHGGYQYLADIFTKSARQDSKLGSALRNTDNIYGQNALSFGLSQVLQSRRTATGVGFNFTSTMVSLFGGDLVGNSCYSSRDKRGISTVEYIALTSQHLVTDFVLNNSFTKAVSLERLAWLVANKRSASPFYFENFKDLVGLKIDTGAGADGVMAGDHLFDSAMRQIESLKTTGTQKESEWAGQSSFFYEHECLSDTANCLMFLMAKNPEQCPKAFRCERGELISHLQSIKHYATSTESFCDEIINQLLTDSVADCSAFSSDNEGVFLTL